MSKTVLMAAMLLFGCGSRNVDTKGNTTSKTTNTSSTVDAGTKLRMSVAVAWSVEKREPMEQGDPITTVVKIAQTIETGSKDHSEVGVVEGTCSEKRVDKSAGPKALLWLYCEHNGKGIQLKLVKHGFDLVVLKGRVEEGEIAYDEFKRVKLPMGARVTTAPMEK